MPFVSVSVWMKYSVPSPFRIFHSWPAMTPSTWAFCSVMPLKLAKSIVRPSPVVSAVCGPGFVPKSVTHPAERATVSKVSVGSAPTSELYWLVGTEKIASPGIPASESVTGCVEVVVLISISAWPER